MTTTNKSFIIIAMMLIISLILSIIAINKTIDLPTRLSIKDIYQLLKGIAGNPLFQNLAVEATLAYVGSIVVISFSGTILTCMALALLLEMHVKPFTLWNIAVAISIFSTVILIVSIISLVYAENITNISWLIEHAGKPN